jgi:hypothetical protein
MLSSRRNPFGLGWALVGACPGPIYILIGAGFGAYSLYCWDIIRHVPLWSFKTNCLTNEIFTKQ